jgi:hypothetical protein
MLSASVFSIKWENYCVRIKKDTAREALADDVHKAVFYISYQCEPCGNEPSLLIRQKELPFECWSPATSKIHGRPD